MSIRHERQTGFTLTELMITVGIVAILTTIAYPSYQAHMLKTRRMDAEGVLMGLASAMERYYTLNNTYVGTAATGTLPQAPASTLYPSQAPLDGTTKYYNLTIQAATATAFTIRATPISGGPQASNGYLELTQSGVRRWDRNADGDTSDTNETSWD